MKSITIDQILTAKEIAQAQRLYRTLGGTRHFARAVKEKLIEPNMERINKALGQENDPMYLAYCIEHVLNQQP